MLLVSDYDIITEPIRSIIIFLQLMLTIGCICICFLSYRTIKKKDPNIKKSYFFGIPFFFLLVGISRLILLYHDYSASDNLDSQLIFIANGIFLIGFIILNYSIETSFNKKTHYIFTSFGIILTSIYLIIFFINQFPIIYFFAVTSQVIAPLSIYLIVMKKGIGELKKKASIIVLGLILLIIAQSSGLFELIGFMDRVSSSMFGPPVALIGLIILGYGFSRIPNKD